MRTRLTGLAVILTLGTVTPFLHAQTWDLANDFSIASNPNGAWSYGNLTDPSTTSSFVTAPNGTSGTNSVGSVLVWGYNNGATPAVLLYQTSAEDFGVEPGHAALECDFLNPDARWTAPADGIYNISLSIGTTDTNGPDGFGDAHVGNANLSINDVVQTPDSFVNNNKQWSRTVSLHAGDTVDAWMFNAFIGGNTDTTFTITTDTPEPTTALLLLPATLLLRKPRRRN